MVYMAATVTAVEAVVVQDGGGGGGYYGGRGGSGGGGGGGGSGMQFQVPTSQEVCETHGDSPTFKGDILTERGMNRGGIVSLC